MKEPDRRQHRWNRRTRPETVSELWTLKLIRNNDVRRFPIEGSPMCTTLEQLRMAAGYLFGLVENEQAALIFMYMDEEGDLCTLCDATLPDALCRASRTCSLRLFMVAGVEKVQPPLSTRTQNEGATSSLDAWCIQGPGKYFLPPRPSYPSPCPRLNQARSWTRRR